VPSICTPSIPDIDIPSVPSVCIPEHHHHHHSCPSISVPSISTMDYCSIGYGVEWARRFPATKEGFLIQVMPSPTLEII
jgi:hypothetical protein